MKVFRSIIIPPNCPKSVRARLMKQQTSMIMHDIQLIHFVWEPLSLEKVQAYDNKGNKVGITSQFAKVLNSHELKWTIQCFILKRDKNGKNKLDDHTVDIETPVKHGDIARAIADGMYALIDEFKDSPYADTFITSGWICNSFNNTVTIDQAYDLFDAIGSWKLKAEFEKEYQQ